MGEITLLCDKYGSDKGSYTDKNHPYPWRAHTYSYIYEAMFRKIKNKVKNVFECGIGTNNVNVPSNMTETANQEHHSECGGIILKTLKFMVQT